ncbi:MAG TPA: tetratricopeptide repeat protein [Saprospiraceae bacterium]|nr:tetratricopeptide repeat protein [Saprospiraceae bacterium]
MSSDNSGKYYKQLRTTVRVYESHFVNGTTCYLGEKEFLEIIEHYENEDQLEEALTAANYALEYHPFSVDFFIIKASILLELLHPEAALDIVIQGRALGFLYTDLLLLEAECHMLLNNLDEALHATALAKENAKADEKDEVYFSEALVYEHFQMFNGCFDSLSNVLRYNPRHANGLLKIWWCTEMTERYRESCKLYHELIDRDPYNAQLWYNLGHAYACLEEYDKSIDAFEYAYLAEPKFEFAYRDCAEICMKADKYDLALQSYRELMEFTIPDAEILSKCGYCHTNLENYTMARDMYTKAIALEPNNSKACFGMAINAFYEGRMKEALSSVTKAISLDDSFEEYMLLKANILADMLRIADAESAFNQAIEMAPENAQCWIKYFSYLLSAGNFERAFHLVEEARFYHQEKEIITAHIVALCAVGKNNEAQSAFLTAMSEDLFEPGLYSDLLPESVYNVYSDIA